jgi:hypothetical protein
MSNPAFNIVFYGIIQPGKDKEMVIANMAKLFKAPPEKIRPYFAGGRKVIKSGVDDLTAEKYRVALENVGLVIKIEQTDAAAEAKQAPSASADKSAASVAATDTSGITVAEPGADVIENPPAVEPQPIGDISDISLAEPGADVLENPPAVEPQPIGDIGDISLAEPGADLIENPPKKKSAPVPDTSDLSLEKEK